MNTGHLIGMILILGICGCAGEPDTRYEDTLYLSSATGRNVECRKVAGVGTRIRNRLECGNAVDGASVAAFKKWRTDALEDAAFREAMMRSADSQYGTAR